MRVYEELIAVICRIAIKWVCGTPKTPFRYHKDG